MNTNRLPPQSGAERERIVLEVAREASDAIHAVLEVWLREQAAQRGISQPLVVQGIIAALAHEIGGLAVSTARCAAPDLAPQSDVKILRAAIRDLVATYYEQKERERKP